MLREPGTAGIKRLFERLFEWVSSAVKTNRHTDSGIQEEPLPTGCTGHRPERRAGY